jgi:hypothetical protein
MNNSSANWEQYSRIQCIKNSRATPDSHTTENVPTLPYVFITYQVTNGHLPEDLYVIKYKGLITTLAVLKGIKTQHNNIQ